MAQSKQRRQNQNQTLGHMQDDGSGSGSVTGRQRQKEESSATFEIATPAGTSAGALEKEFARVADGGLLKDRIIAAAADAAAAGESEHREMYAKLADCFRALGKISKGVGSKMQQKIPNEFYSQMQHKICATLRHLLPIMVKQLNSPAFDDLPNMRFEVLASSQTSHSFSSSSCFRFIDFLLANLRQIDQAGDQSQGWGEARSITHLDEQFLEACLVRFIHCSWFIAVESLC